MFRAVDYGASAIVAKTGNSEEQGDGTNVSVLDAYRVQSTQALAPGIPIGQRMPSTKVLNQSDARPWHFQELLPSNGRWRIAIFTGNITQPSQRQKLTKLGTDLTSPTSFLKKYTPPQAHPAAVFEILAIHSAPRATTTIFDFPPVFRPYDDLDGWDYSKIYVDDDSYHEGHGRIYETFGISEDGCAVVIRPDQYISYVGKMDDVESMNRFFGGFMIASRVGKEGTAVGPEPVGNGVEIRENGVGMEKVAVVQAATTV